MTIQGSCPGTYWAASFHVFLSCLSPQKPFCLGQCLTRMSLLLLVYLSSSLLQIHVSFIQQTFYSFIIHNCETVVQRYFFGENSRIKYILINVKLKTFFPLSPCQCATKTLWSGPNGPLPSFQKSSHKNLFVPLAALLWQSSQRPLESSVTSYICQQNICYSNTAKA